MENILDFFQTIWIFIIDWYWAPLFILYIGVISTILIENRDPSKTIAWILVIIFLPVLGLILYYLFGQKFKKVQILRRKSHLQATRLKEEFLRLEPVIQDSLVTLQGKIGNLTQVFSYLKNERISLPSISNDVKLLINGEQKFEELIKSITQARHSIHLEYYIFELDSVGSRVLEELEKKAQSGVHVRLIVDSFGSPQMKKYFRKHKKSKIKFQEFLPVSFSSLANSNYRNHRKIAIIDAEIAYIGGINISERYANPNADNLYWRDTAVSIRGEAVGMLQINFWTSWNQTGGKHFDLDEHYLGRHQSYKGEAAVSFVVSDPGSPAPYNMEALLMAINEARHIIQLCTPYYIPSEELETALMMAASAGIRVELMIPAEGDSWIVQHASFSFLKPLLERGVHVFLYQKGFLHAKTVNIDGKLSFIGTVNLDTRSFFINYEIAALVSDETLCAQLQQQFEQDKLDSQIISLKMYKNRKRWKRGVDSLCRLLAPLL